MSKVEFPQGLIVKVPEKKPDFVICKVSIKRDEFITWAKEQGEWINLDLCESRGGKHYAKVDNWKPKKEEYSGSKEEYKPTDDNSD